jgi:hypothetical protein
MKDSLEPGAKTVRYRPIRRSNRLGFVRYWIAVVACVGCSGGGQSVKDALPPDLDKNGVAKALAGTWETTVDFGAKPDGSEDKTTYRYTFVFMPDKWKHGSFTRKPSGQGDWTLLESEKESDGTYRGRIQIFDTRDGPESQLANGPNSGRREFEKMTATTFEEVRQIGGRDNFVWKKVGIDTAGASPTRLTPASATGAPEAAAAPVSHVKYIPGYALTGMLIALGTYIVCRPSRRFEERP